MSPLPLVVGALITLVLGTGVSAAVVRSDEPAAPVPVTTTTVVAPTTTAVVALPTSTTVVVPTSTTRVTIPRPTTTRPPTTATAPVAPTTVAPTTTTTTRAPLTRAAATQALCSDIQSSLRLVADGNAVAGGLRLLQSLGTNGNAADPLVVIPARQMVSAGLSGDITAGYLATLQAASACRQLGFPIIVPGGTQCLVGPCP